MIIFHVMILFSIVSEQQLETLTEYFNSNVLENKIKFTRETSKNELVFLDTKAHLKDGFLISEFIPSQQIRMNI